MAKWEERQRTGDALERYKARQFIGIIAGVGPIAEFDIDLYCAFVEKTTVMGRRKLIVSLLDGTDVEYSCFPWFIKNCAVESAGFCAFGGLPSSACHCSRTIHGWERTDRLADNGGMCMDDLQACR